MVIAGLVSSTGTASGTERDRRREEKQESVAKHGVTSGTERSNAATRPARVPGGSPLPSRLAALGDLREVLPRR